MSDQLPQAGRRLRPKEIRSSALVRNLINYYTIGGTWTATHSKAVANSYTSMFNTDTTCSSAYSYTGSVTTPEEIDFLEGTNSETLRHDPTLTAFAQLACSRLGMERSFISLIDHEFQYVIAEATRSVSLHDPKKSKPDDGLWVGTIRLPAAWGLCPDTIHTFNCEDGSMDENGPEITANRNCYVVNDLSVPMCFRDKPYVVGAPYMRFYAEVPIKSQSGHILGGFCVVDPKPRQGLSPESLEILLEISAALTDHLSLVAAQEQLQRSQDMMRGLGRFVAQKSVGEWWKGAFNEKFQGLGTTRKQSTSSFGAAVQSTSTGSGPRDGQHGRSAGLADPADPIHNIQKTGMPATELSSRLATIGDTAAAKIGNIPSLEGSESDLEFHDPKMSITTRASGFTTPQTHSYEDTPSPGECAQSSLKSLFSRASHLIRASCDLEGIVFVDASLQDIPVEIKDQDIDVESPVRTGCATHPRQGSMADHPHRSQATTAIERPGTSHDDPYHALNWSSESRKSNPLSPVCDLLGYALHGDAGILGRAPLSNHLLLPQSTLRGLLMRYPRGEVFLFSDDGTLLDFDEHRDMNCCLDVRQQARQEFEKKKEYLRAYQLLDFCPGARAIMFFPLWDPQTDQWFAGSFAWTKNPARLLAREDVTFMAAFGSCIMGEKSKMDAMRIERARTKFISSLSHELRSPLHGILATTDFMNDTDMNEEQEEMVRTISGCGEILLDTLDHLLDSTKFSNTHWVNKISAVQGLSRPGPLGRSTSFDFSNLVEIVVEGVFAGHRHWHGQNDRNDKGLELSNKPFRNNTPNWISNVMVILHIQHQQSWIVEGQNGAWKRILTNVFSNALKYTESGFIRVSLEMQNLGFKSDTDADQPVVALEVEDSGIGISKDFMRHRMFIPFSQANPHSSGTGLGLSMVRQLVSDLGGVVRINSDLRQGTTATISGPIALSSSQQSNMLPAGSRAVIRDIAVWCRGLTLCLVGFDHYPEIHEIPTGIASTHERRMLAIRSSISNFASEWFGLKVISTPALATASGDIFIGVASQLIMSQMESKTAPLIVFEDNYSSARDVDILGVFPLSQPVGPLKFARMLGLCLEYRISCMDSSPEGNSATSYEFPPIMDNPQSQTEGRSTNRIMSKRIRSRSRKDFANRDPKSRSSLPSPAYRPGPPDIKPRSVVLLVEDDSVNMKILINHMTRAKEEHISAFDGLEAVQVYEVGAMEIKLIFMDIAMPVKDGIQATKEIRRIEAEKSLPRVRIVALTCFSSEEYQRDACRAGVDIFLVKPVSMKSLKPVLELDPADVVPPKIS